MGYKKFRNLAGGIDAWAVKFDEKCLDISDLAQVQTCFLPSSPFMITAFINIYTLATKTTKNISF